MKVTLIQGQTIVTRAEQNPILSTTSPVVKDTTSDSDNGSKSQGKEPKKINIRKRKSAKFRKAPQAPKRGKSAFILFSITKHSEAREKGRGNHTKTVPDRAKLISEQWRNLSASKRAIWIEKANKDKLRYEMEKSMYIGPWKLPTGNKRAKKDPKAPKRPMSAFLAYSKKMRSQVKNDHTSINNINVSKVLAEMWRNSPKDERDAFIEKEAQERAVYKVATLKWRKQRDEKIATERNERESFAREAVEYHSRQPPSPMRNSNNEAFYQCHQASGYGLENNSSGNPRDLNKMYDPMTNESMPHVLSNSWADTSNITRQHSYNCGSMCYQNNGSIDAPYRMSSFFEPMTYKDNGRQMSTYQNQGETQWTYHDNVVEKQQQSRGYGAFHSKYTIVIFNGQCIENDIFHVMPSGQDFV